MKLLFALLATVVSVSSFAADVEKVEYLGQIQVSDEHLVVLSTKTCPFSKTGEPMEALVYDENYKITQRICWTVVGEGANEQVLLVTPEGRSRKFDFSRIQHYYDRVDMDTF